MQIATYQTEAGARRYALELKASTHAFDFAPCSHPHSFAWSVAVFDRSTNKRVAYAGKRPRGGPRLHDAVNRIIEA